LIAVFVNENWNELLLCKEVVEVYDDNSWHIVLKVNKTNNYICIKDNMNKAKKKLLCLFYSVKQ